MTELSKMRGTLEVWCRANWDRIPPDARRRCIDHIRPKFAPSDLAEFCAQHARGEQIGHHIPSFHFFGGGMAIRNCLREVLKDDMLPLIKQHDGWLEQNWDDFYTGALEQLCEEENAR